ncbi:hypothetical protein [Maricaulis sp.]|uniref:hypothetical protein n=1 Tax=Maricaulis sp. TaxID=1486257 RepID=UPI0025C1390C|nr:hypothetical protein [Maricaulis sp.]
MKRMSLAAGLAAGVGLGAIAMAQDAVYTYTDERGSCSGQLLTSEDERASYVQACDGVGGWTWYSVSGEHGQSSRFSDRQDPDVGGQYGGYIGNFGEYHTVIEWRVGLAGAPYATIHRYVSATFETGDAERQETLIVTTLRSGETPTSCHVGYVDATAVPNANAIAREMADRLAPDFDCARGEIWVVDAASPGLDAALENGSTRRAY